LNVKPVGASRDQYALERYTTESSANISFMNEILVLNNLSTLFFFYNTSTV